MSVCERVHKGRSKSATEKRREDEEQITNVYQGHEVMRTRHNYCAYFTLQACAPEKKREEPEGLGEHQVSVPVTYHLLQVEVADDRIEGGGHFLGGGL